RGADPAHARTWSRPPRRLVARWPPGDLPGRARGVRRVLARGRCLRYRGPPVVRPLRPVSLVGLARRPLDPRHGGQRRRAADPDAAGAPGTDTGPAAERVRP